MYKDKDKQREAQRDWVRQKRAEAKGSTHIIDACNKEHPIDFEGRRKDYELLESWANGDGTEYQRRLGILAREYRPLDFIVTSYMNNEEYEAGALKKAKPPKGRAVALSTT